LVLSIFAFAALCVLIGLGTWQMQRLQWKNELITKIETRTGLAPIGLAEVMETRRQGGGRDDTEYRPVRVSGRFDHSKAVRVYELDHGRAGWHVYTPLILPDRARVFINRGFVPDPLDGSTPVLHEPEGDVTVVGLVRKPPGETSIFTPRHTPGTRRFYWRNFTQMVGAIEDKMNGPYFFPVFVDQIAASQSRPADAQWPAPGTTRVNLNNRHLEYAITWYGLALALVGVYGFFMFGGRRRREGEGGDT